MERVIAAAHLTADNWPGRPEADDARMDLGILYIYCGDTKQALKQFDSVNPKSERYPKALYMAGLTHWQLYLHRETEAAGGGQVRREGDGRTPQAGRRQDHARATRRSEKLAPADKPMPELLIKTKLLWRKSSLKGATARPPCRSFQRLIDAVKAKQGSFDPPTVQNIFLGGVKAYINAGDLDTAGDVGMLLIELGADSDAVNRELINFAKLLDNQRKKADADLTNAVGPAEQEAARTRLVAMNDLLGKIAHEAGQSGEDVRGEHGLDRGHQFQGRPRRRRGETVQSLPPARQATTRTSRRKAEEGREQGPHRGRDQGPHHPHRHPRQETEVRRGAEGSSAAHQGPTPGVGAETGEVPPPASLGRKGPEALRRSPRRMGHPPAAIGEVHEQPEIQGR